jgi:hypothetical protein
MKIIYFIPIFLMSVTGCQSGAGSSALPPEPLICGATADYDSPSFYLMDANQNPLTNATVTFTDPETSMVYPFQNDGGEWDAGEYFSTAPLQTDHDYVLTISLAGYQTITHNVYFEMVGGCTIEPVVYNADNPQNPTQFNETVTLQPTSP